MCPFEPLLLASMPPALRRTSMLHCSSLAALERPHKSKTRMLHRVSGGRHCWAGQHVQAADRRPASSRPPACSACGVHKPLLPPGLMPAKLPSWVLPPRSLSAADHQQAAARRSSQRTPLQAPGRRAGFVLLFHLLASGLSMQRHRVVQSCLDPLVKRLQHTISGTAAAGGRM